MAQVVYRGINIHEDNEFFLNLLLEEEIEYFHNAVHMCYIIWSHVQDCNLIIFWYDEHGNKLEYFQWRDFDTPEICQDFMSAFQQLSGIPVTVKTHDCEPTICRYDW